MVPEIEPGSEWTARKIAERWIEYIPELLPAGINSLLVSDYRSEQYKIRRATGHVQDLIKKGVLKETTGEPVEVRSTREYLKDHPVYGLLPASETKITINVSRFVLGKDLWGYENTGLKKGNDVKVSKLNLSKNPEAQKEWMLDYVEKHQIDIKERLPDTVLGQFLEEAEKVGMTENSFVSRRRELGIRGIDRSEIKKKA